MDRREFIKMCSVAGLGVASSQLPGTYIDANAQEGKRIFPVFINGGGGWDIFRVTNPKGNQNNAEGFALNSDFAEGDIRSVAGTSIEYAPVGNNQQFFDTHGSIMTVINGVDCETNGHDTGQQNFMSGRLQQSSPCLPALIAAALGGALPLSFITNGGYDSTIGVPVSKTRLGSTQELNPMIEPNAINAEDPENSEKFHTAETFSRITATRQARLDDMQQSQHLPLVKSKMNLLYTARQGMGDLKKIKDFLPEDPMNGIEGQAEIVLAAYAAGLCQTATLRGGGFDTHGNNDQNQDDARSNLFNGAMRLIQRAEELNIADEILVFIGSDFGRSPRYNDAQGKDHWSVGCVLVLDPSGEVPGGRVFGATNEVGEHEQVDANGAVGGNVTIKNSSIHQWARKHIGIEDHEVVKLFPLNVGDNVLNIT